MRDNPPPYIRHTAWSGILQRFVALALVTLLVTAWKGKSPALAIALLTRVSLETRSASQSRKWQLTGMS